ncbi:GxxExxY protein [Luteibaculum oceani]|uniref:GxxExxY protein n=1 Tax=Luteibaculum oceani TaxID=1294296 RepID=A0A5C6V0A4_9FLAO|nr:GxxExxY protein [Luteibaculum oceani]TXC78937.1 GxxExxY protein [Luteibaculum oceani]
MDANALSYHVIKSALKVHTELGPGLLESAYEACLQYELIDRGFKVERQKSLPVIYEGVKVEAGYRIDLMVNDLLIIELKSVDKIAPIHTAQVMTYLKLSNLKLGLLLNFNVPSLKLGIRRVII